MKIMDIGKRKTSVIVDVAIFFLIAIFLTGSLTYIFETLQADTSVTKQTELYATEIASEVKLAMQEYPAYPSGCSALEPMQTSHEAFFSANSFIMSSP